MSTVETEVSVLDLVRRVRAACGVLNPKNPTRRLLEECEQAVTDLALQLHEARGGNRVGPGIPGWWRRLLKECKQVV